MRVLLPFKIEQSNNRLSVTNAYDCVLAMMLGLSRNGRLVVTQFPVSTTSETVSVIRRDAKRCPGWQHQAVLTLAQCLKCRGGSLTWYTGPPSLGPDLKDPAILRLEACWRLFVNMTLLGLHLPTMWLTAQASSNCATLTPGHPEEV